MIAQNPCDLCELPRLEKTEMKYLSPEETTRFLDAAKDTKHYVVFLLVIKSCMCPEEYLYGLPLTDMQ